ncbi:MAG: redoxin domain-containing protein, partial [Bacteroidales bacterium]|nr:redoxin domain-containing protein [Bacteroidales bacterium]
GKAAPVTLNFVQEEKKVITVGDVMTIPSEGGTFAVDIQYNTDFDVVVESGAQSWITFVATRALKSGKLEFRFAENQSTDPRQGKVTVKDKSGKVSDITLTFVQEEKKVITVGDVMEIPAEGGTFAVDVQYNTDVVVEVESAAQSWIHFVAVRALTSGKLEFSFDANPNPDVRTGKVTVKDKNGKVAPITLTFVQAEKKVITVGDVMEIPAEGGTFSVDVQYNTDVVVEVESAAQSWITFVATRSLQSGKLEFRFEANPNTDPRQGTVIVKDKSGKAEQKTLTFVQKEKTVINVGETTDIPEEGGLFEVDIQYNTDFDVKVAADAKDWITFVATRSLTSGKLQFQIAPNDDDDIRTGTVIIYDKNGWAEPVSISFRQLSKVRRVLMEFFYALDGPNWKKKNGWGTDVSLNDWDGVNLYYEGHDLHLCFDEFGLKGEVPECIGELTSLIELRFDSEPGLTGTLPSSFANLVNLKSITLYNTSMTSLPDVFGGMKDLSYVFIFYNPLMAGPLPESLGKSDNMQSFSISSNHFEGPIPASWAKLTDIQGFSLENNHLSGKIPDTFLSVSGETLAHRLERILQQADGYSLDITDLDMPGYWPLGTITSIDGKTFTFADIVKKNKYTVYLSWATWCPFSYTLMPQLKEYYQNYKKDGLEIIATIWHPEDVNADNHGFNEEERLFEEQYIHKKGYDLWYNFYFAPYYGNTRITHAVPVSEVYDKNGNVLFSTQYFINDPVRKRYGKNEDDLCTAKDLIPFLETLLGPAVTPDPYSSTDYSKDGEVMTLQKASVGKGINIVFLGDAYTDKDMDTGGLYETVMRQAMEEFFAIEPYKTFRNRFNVYAVKVVSRNGRVGEGNHTALGSVFGGGTDINGDHGKCVEYALKVPGITDTQDLLISVLVNTKNQVGTTYLYESHMCGIAFTASLGNDPELFGSTLRHESGGHGFAFLADEYSENNSTPPQSHIDEYTSKYEQYGWFANVDFTNDPTKIHWSAFLSDDRYKNEVGIFEGAALYNHGAYRPSENSMMKDNAEYFNAPSRWVIYKRIMELSGESYSFQTFLEYDAVNRAKASQAAVRPPLKAAANGRSFEHTAPPVVIP